MNKYTETIERYTQEHGTKFDSSELAEKFIEYFDSGKRIEVKTMGELKRGTIGITTGWKPCFLLMLTKRSRGSCYILSDRDIIIKEIKQ